LFMAQNSSIDPGMTSIKATYLLVDVKV
jgi:hypothetical protein